MIVGLGGQNRDSLLVVLVHGKKLSLLECAISIGIDGVVCGYLHDLVLLRTNTVPIVSYSSIYHLLVVLECRILLVVSHFQSSISLVIMMDVHFLRGLADLFCVIRSQHLVRVIRHVQLNWIRIASIFTAVVVVVGCGVWHLG